MRSFIILALTLAAATAAPPAPLSNRIIGGEITTINQYPEMAALLKGFGNSFSQECGSVIVSQRTILTAAHCVMFSTASSYRVRVSSTMHQSGGFVHNIISIILHPNFNQQTLDSDIAVLYTVSSIPNSPTSRYASIAGPNYIPADNQPVWATGWGMTVPGNVNSGSFPLRHVQIWVVNQAICKDRYANRITNGVLNPIVVTDNMLCSGWLDVGGRDQCQGDSGGPLYHNGVVVGICSWGESCALAQYPGVNTRVSKFANWIQQVAL